MNFELTGAQEALVEEVEAFCRREVTPELLGEVEREGHGHHAGFYRKMVEAGLIGFLWPKDYGGRGLGRVEVNLFTEVLGRHDAPLGAFGTTVGIVATALMEFGSEAHKKELLPRIGRGEVLCALGMTEPDAGSDAAAIRTTAVRDGDVYVVNGSKIFTTYAHVADYILALVRTDPKAEKHAGVSMLLLDTKLAGVTIRRLKALGISNINECVFESVRVPVSMLVGTENRGFYQLAKGFEFERVGLGNLRNIPRIFEDLIAYAKTHRQPADPLEPAKEPPLVWESAVLQARAARIAARLRAARLLYFYAAWRQDNQLKNDVVSSMSKLYSGDLFVDVAEFGMEVLGLAGQLRADEETAPLRGQLELLYRHCVAKPIGGGTSEIQRGIIATRGLGLPKAG